MKKLKILHIEDNPDDAFLIKNELKKLRSEIFYKVVDNEQSLKESLNIIEWDLVLCDFTLPLFSGLEALKIIRQIYPIIPIIFVSSTMDEFIEKQAILEGANDYVNKNNLARLIPAIREYIQKDF